jgi:hypothetical protein
MCDNFFHATQITSMLNIFRVSPIRTCTKKKKKILYYFFFTPPYLEGGYIFCCYVAFHCKCSYLLYNKPQKVKGWNLPGKSNFPSRNLSGQSLTYIHVWLNNYLFFLNFNLFWNKNFFFYPPFIDFLFQSFISQWNV